MLLFALPLHCVLPCFSHYCRRWSSWRSCLAPALFFELSAALEISPLSERPAWRARAHSILSGDRHSVSFRYTVAIAPWATTSSRLSILRQRSALQPAPDQTPLLTSAAGRRSACASYAAFRFRYCPFFPLRRYFSLFVSMRHSTVTSQRIMASRATFAFFLRRNFS